MVNSRRQSGGRPDALARVCVGTLSLLLVTVLAAAADEPLPAGPETGAMPATEPAREPADRDQAARRAYSVGTVLLGGILMLGVTMIAVALMWGNRARRIARQELPPIAPRDELWFLRKKPANSKKALPAGPSEDETGPSDST